MIEAVAFGFFVMGIIYAVKIIVLSIKAIWEHYSK